MTDILTSLIKHDSSSVDGIGSYTVNLSGDPDARAIIDATVAHYDLSHRPEVTQEQLDSLFGQKITILRSAQGSFGHAAIETMEGTVFSGTRGLGLLPKGKRSKGFSLQTWFDRGEILDLELGYGKDAVLTERVMSVRDRFPQVERLTQEDLNALPNRSNSCSLAIFGTYPFYGDKVPATVWLCHSYLRGDDIVENALFIDPRSGGTSEHGSCYGKDLLRMSVGKVLNYNPISFKDAVELTNREDAHDRGLQLLAQTTEATV